MLSLFRATYYLQGGVAGACGTVYPDSALIVAERAYCSLPLTIQSHKQLNLILFVNTESQRFTLADCGRQVQVTNTQNGQSVVATVADECPGCQGNPNSLDLSEGAFEAIADLSAGVVPISWVYLS